MNYCESCMMLNDGDRCKRCDCKKLREVRPGDFCFLDERPQMWADMLSDVLTQNGIPNVSRSVLGAGLAMSVGANLDRHRVFVPYENYDAALELDKELFAENG